MNRIMELRTKKGFTQQTLGLKFSEPKDVAVISRWERGITLPNLQSAIELSSILGEPIEKIFTSIKTDKAVYKLEGTK